jgi:hypothetical protein
MSERMNSMSATKQGRVPSMSNNKDLEKLSVVELKATLENIWRKHEKLCHSKMAPLLYHLRLKIKAQGKSGAGFGAWVEDHLDISRRTADRWADQWAISKGLMKPRKKSTFRQLPKSEKESRDGQITVPLSFTLPKEEADKFFAAMQILGDRATNIVYAAIVSAAYPSTMPAQSAQSTAQSASAQSSRTTLFLDDKEEGTLVEAMQGRATGEGR